MLADRVRMGSEIVKFYDTMTISSLNVGDIFYFNHMPLTPANRWRIILKLGYNVLIEQVAMQYVSIASSTPVNYASSPVDNWMMTYYNSNFSAHGVIIPNTTIQAYTVSGTTIANVDITRKMFPLGYRQTNDGLNTTNANSYYNRNGSDYAARTTWEGTPRSKFMRTLDYGPVGGMEGNHFYYRVIRAGTSYADVLGNNRSLYFSPACYLANDAEVLIKMV